MQIASKSSATFLVFALRPCEVLDNVIRQTKIKTGLVAGNQLYLTHPPHLTLYVAAFDSLESVANSCREIVSQWAPPHFEILGWHHFASDVLTGSHTLVCELGKDDQQLLREYQSSLIRGLKDLRSVDTSFERYRPHFASLSSERQQAVQSVGFPFIGSDWIPHFTVASIEPSKWTTVWNSLKDHPPQGAYLCRKLSIFRLVDEFPQDWLDIDIGM